MGILSDSDSESGPTARSAGDGPLSTVTEPILRVLLAIRGSFLLFVGSVGVLFLASGATVMKGVLAGMFAIWGVSCLLYAALGFGFLTAIGYR